MSGQSIPAPCNHRSDTLLLKPCRLLNHEPGGLPPKYMLYVGRTVPGEWFIITVDVKHACSYDADLFYTSNRSGAISLDVNGKGATGPVSVPPPTSPPIPSLGDNGITGISRRICSGPIFPRVRMY